MTKAVRIISALFSISLCLISCTGRGDRDLPETAEFTETRNAQTTQDIRTESEKASEGDTAQAPVDTLPHGVPTMAEAALTEEEIDLIARLVAAEAGGEPYMTQVCLAALVLNRIEAAAFPNTVAEVIFDGGAFPSVAAGLVSLKGNGEDTSSRKYAVARKAVLDAMDGLDPTAGALYFSRKENPDPYVLISYECGGMFFGK